MGPGTYYFVGANLSEGQALQIFRAETEKTYKDACPKDNTPNPDRKNYCSECGSQLYTLRKVKVGADSLHGIEDLPVIKSEELETFDYYNGILIGQFYDSVGEEREDIGCRAAYTTINRITGLKSPSPTDLAKLVKKLERVGINQLPSLFEITVEQEYEDD